MESGSVVSGSEVYVKMGSAEEVTGERRSRGQMMFCLWYEVRMRSRKDVHVNEGQQLRALFKSSPVYNYPLLRGKTQFHCHHSSQGRDPATLDSRRARITALFPAVEAREAPNHDMRFASRWPSIIFFVAPHC